VPNDAFFAAIRLAWDHYDAPHSSWANPSVSADAMRLDPDEHALSSFRLGVFICFTTRTDLPLMQAHVLELYERARGEGGAGRFASWHRVREIVAGRVMSHRRVQGNSALGL
jgi:hypothetical protein